MGTSYDDEIHTTTTTGENKDGQTQFAYAKIKQGGSFWEVFKSPYNPYNQKSSLGLTPLPFFSGFKVQ